ncbi:MAG TPA: hypothetical protein H9756_07785 [Candidatus Mediterraneibacter gallistercoris]|uniref:YqzL family protein n=1 Tax=Candidatus Mediterraneibacter gallistercoris TaxID=2838671 RepID=A0A9D2P3R5_9FIRM|nr:hypothetical protein [Candidatus Mediterraneibacter gallistercoris]
MKENYWNQFMASGRIDDYLRFKMHEKNSGEQEASRGKEQRESDRTYRYGSLDHAHRRI